MTTTPQTPQSDTRQGAPQQGDAQQQAAPYLVFVSYSHANSGERDRLLNHLRTLENVGLCKFWFDKRAIGPGRKWRPEIEAALAGANMALLIITAEFLGSKFIKEEEVPRILERNRDEGLVVYPILTKPCHWKSHTWLCEIQMRPECGEPVCRDNGLHFDDEMAAITEEIERIIKGEKPVPVPPPLPIPVPPPPPEKWWHALLRYLSRLRQWKREAGYALLSLVAVAAVIYALTPPTGSVVTNNTNNANTTNANASGKKEPKLFIGPWGGNIRTSAAVSEKWDVPPEWMFAPLPVTKKQGLIVKGEGVGLMKLPEQDQSLNNYTVTFELSVVGGQRSASWLLHAQSKNTYYKFVMTFPVNGEGAKLLGDLYVNGRHEHKLDPEKSITLPFTKDFQEGDELYIIIEVKDYKFTHSINVTSVEQIANDINPGYRLDPSKINPKDTYVRSYFDPAKRLDHGLFGFKADADEIRVKSLDITAKSQ